MAVGGGQQSVAVLVLRCQDFSRGPGRRGRSAEEYASPPSHFKFSQGEGRISIVDRTTGRKAGTCWPATVGRVPAADRLVGMHRRRTRRAVLDSPNDDAALVERCRAPPSAWPDSRLEGEEAGPMIGCPLAMMR